MRERRKALTGTPLDQALVVIAFIDPQLMVNLVGKPEVKAVADAAEQRLRRACESVGRSTTGPT